MSPAELWERLAAAARMLDGTGVRLTRWTDSDEEFEALAREAGVKPWVSVYTPDAEHPEPTAILNFRASGVEVWRQRRPATVAEVAQLGGAGCTTVTP